MRLARLTEIDKWLGDEKWDVVHFNWGLHDLKRNDADKNLVPLADYERNLVTLVTRLKKTDAKLIWGATTPVSREALTPGHSDNDVEAYNAAALEIMKQHGVTVNDLYAFCLPRLKELQRPSNVHFSPAGARALAEQTAKAIQAALPAAKTAASEPKE